MGIFSSIGKFFKKVWGGIKKVFKAVMKPIGKLLGSDIGKILLLAISVFSMGSALIAGGKGFLAGEGFIGKFINGGKAFLNSLLNTNFETTKAPGVENIANVGAGTGEAFVPPPEVSPGDILTGGSDATNLPGGATPNLLTTGGTNLLPGSNVSRELGMPAMQAGTKGNLLTEGITAAGKVTKDDPGWLTQAMTAAKEFATSKSGATLIGGAMAGYGDSQRLQAILDDRARVGNMFADPNNPGMQALAAHDFSVTAPRGLADAARSSGSRYAPRVPFRRPAPAGG